MLENKEQYGHKRTKSIKGITIHNTGNNRSAQELANIMATTPNHFATHFFVDDVETIQVMPLDYAVYHTGKGFDLGNERTIAIEICKSTCDIETYRKAQKNAIGLIKELMSEYGLIESDIYFHNDFSNAYCPHRILDIYKTKKEFIRKEF